MGPGSFAYKFVLYLHIASAIIGFGTVFFLGVFGKAAGERRGREGLALNEVAKSVGVVFATPFIYATFLFGIALVFLSGGAVRFEATWLSASILLFIVALAISHGLHRPNLERIVALSRELAEMGPPDSADAGPPSQAIEATQRGRRAALYGTALNLLMLAILALMVFKPGA